MGNTSIDVRNNTDFSLNVGALYNRGMGVTSNPIVTAAQYPESELLLWILGLRIRLSLSVRHTAMTRVSF